MTPTAQETKARLNKWNHTKFIIFYTVKKTTELRYSLQNGRKSLPTGYLSDRTLISRVYK
jgi:hypothetical protein